MADALIEAAFPAIILALGIMAVLGASIANVIAALVMVLAPSAVRTVRAQALAIKEMDYVMAARAVGCSDWRILCRYLTPNCLGVLIVLATISLGFAIITEASLSFLGVGVPPDVPTWGGMLAKAGSGYVEAGPWLAVFPGLALTEPAAQAPGLSYGVKPPWAARPTGCCSRERRASRSKTITWEFIGRVSIFAVCCIAS